MIPRYKNDTLAGFCRTVAKKDHRLQAIIDAHGLPPLWIRPNNFATLVLIILEQQVSLASAYAAFKKLQNHVSTITPENLVALSDAEFRACYLSRQKTSYVRGLAAAVLSGQINFEALELLPDDAVRAKLKTLNGIGDWTVDIYLIHALQRCDVLPLGDLALVNAYRKCYGEPAATKEMILETAAAWKPYRTFATLLLWHYYLQTRQPGWQPDEPTLHDTTNKSA